MNSNARVGRMIVLAFAVMIGPTVSQAATINADGPWVVTNGSANVTGANTNSPTFTPASGTLLPGLTVQTAIPTITLANTGDYIQARGTYLLERAPTNPTNLTNASRLNVQMRIGLFDAPAAPSTGVSGDPRGFIAEYGTGSPAGNVRGLIATQANPFSGGAATPMIASAGADPEGNFISGTPVEVDFVFRITRNGSNVDLTGQISGATIDPLDNDYLQQFSILGHAPHASFDFDVNRLAFLIGGNIEATTATLQSVRIKSNLIVPEPTTSLLGLLTLVGGVFARRRD